MTSKYLKFKKRYIGITTWLPNYNKAFLKGDITAGLTVGVMLIPQGMAYAQIAGLPLIYGLYASIIPCFIYAFFGSSRQLSVGPTAVLSILVASSIGQLAEANTTIYIQLCITLALLVGIIQLLLVCFRLGFLMNYLSDPVINGFTSAAAFIIGFSQLNHLLGINLDDNKSIQHTIIAIIEQFDNINWVTFSVGISGIIMMLLLKKSLPIIPGALAVVVFGTLATYFFNLNGTFAVKIVETVPSGLPPFSLPTFDMTYIQDLFPMAIMIALISFMESIAIAKAIQVKQKDYILFPNQELIALGLMNIVGSFFQSFPTTGSFSRTAVNEQNGAKTALALIVTGLFITISLLFLTDLFYYLPKPILASIIILSVYGLIDIKEPKKLWYANRQDFWVLIITFVGTLFLGIEKGIVAGIFISMAIVIYETTLPHYAVLGKIPNETYYKDVERFSNLKVRPDTLIMRFEARLYFGNVNHFKKIINNEVKKKGKDLKAFFLDASSMNSMDSSGYHAMEEVINCLNLMEVDFYLIGAKGRVRDEMKRSGLMQKIGKKRIFIEMHHAICEYNDYPYKDFSEYVTQSEAEFININDEEN